jgi:hypothetical protein
MNLSQTFHIFRKDARHHWPEILLCQAALVVYCWHEVGTWSESTGPHLVYGVATFYGVARFIYYLLPLAWGFLIFRVVQSESLAGDRQFWVTRPYEWKALLAAKILFVLAFITLPLLIAGSALLLMAGFSPAPHILGLLWMQLLLMHLPLMPLFALAAISRNLATGLIVLLAVGLYVAGMSALGSFFYGSTFPSHELDWLQGVIGAVAVLIVIALQYTGRKTLQSRLWLAGGAAAMLVAILASHYLVHGEDRYPSPPTGRQPVFKAEFDPVKLAPAKGPADQAGHGVVIPMIFSGVPRGSLASPVSFQLSVEAPDGFRWKSKWLGHYGLWGPGDNHWQPVFPMDQEIYQRLRSVPVKAHVLIALQVFSDRPPRQMAAGDGEFVIPNVGRCRIGQYPDSSGSVIRCHSPLLWPPSVIMRVDPARSTCSLEEKPQSSDAYHFDWVPGRASWLPQSGVTPVQSFGFHFQQMWICPGTPLLLSFPELTDRTRVEFDVQGIKLEDYRYDWSRIVWGPKAPTLPK